VERSLNLKGELVVGESIADLGGLTIAYAAFQKSMQGKPRPPSVGGYPPEPCFFLAVQDPHRRPKFRTNGPLSNMPQFAQAFRCKAGDPMVRAETDRCRVW